MKSNTQEKVQIKSPKPPKKQDASPETQKSARKKSAKSGKERSVKSGKKKQKSSKGKKSRSKSKNGGSQFDGISTNKSILKHK